VAAGDELVGKVLGECRLERVLGRGGMSVAYAGRHRHLDIPVVVKTIDPRRGKKALVEAFLREVKALGAVTHPHVVRLYSAGPDPEGRVLFLVLEHVAGGSLRARLRDGDLEQDELVRILAQAGEGLGAAHAAGIAHGDVKPENLLLDEEGRARVVDFGLAQVAGDPVVGTAVYGTPAYMAPERCRGGPPDARGDVYALGVTLYEGLVDRWPFNAPEAAKLLRKHLDEPPPLEPLREVAPDALVEFVATCLAKDPAERPADGAAFARGLRAAVATPEAAARAPRRRRKRRLSTSSTSTLAVARRERAGGGSSGTAIAAILFAAAICAGVLALYATR
jgi:serine/threonine protein kinase